MSFPGFALGTQLGEQNLAHQRELQDQARQSNLAYYGGILNNPNATDDQKLQAHQAIQGLYPTPLHAPQFLTDLLHLKGRHQQAQQAAQAQSSANVATNTPPTSSATDTSGPPTAINPVEILQGMAAQVPAQQAQAAAQPSQQAPAKPTSTATAKAAPQPVPAGTPAAQSPTLDQVRAIGQAKSPEEALALAHAYASPQQIQNDFAQKMAALNHEYNMQLWGQRIAGNIDVAQIRSQYMLLNTPEKMNLDAQAKSMGYDHFFAVPPQLQAGMLTQYHNAAQPKIVSEPVQDANSPTGWSLASFNPVTQETYNVYPGIKPPPGLVARHRVTTTPGPNGMVTTVSDITPSLPGGKAQPFTPPPARESKANPGGPQGTPKAPVSATTPTGPLEGVSTPPNGGEVNSIAPPPQEAGASPTSSATAAAAPPVNAGARQPGTKPQGAAVKGPKLAPPVPQRPDSSGEEIPPLRNPNLPPLKGADEARIAGITAPVHTVEAQVVGRGRKPLWELAEVLKNPDMLRAVNTAMLAPMLQTPEGNHNISFWGTIATSLGLASAAQQATSDVITEARNKVRQDGGPEALQLLDRLAELKGTIPNLRKVQGGSNALGALEPLYQESPLMNISSPEDFRFRTANMLRTMADSLSEQPGVNRKHVDWLYGQADKAEKGSKSVTPSGKSSNVDAFLKNFGKK